MPKIWYGGDYNPDQWPRATWNEDMRLFNLAAINIVTLPVFSWALLQPSEEQYEFGWLDEIMAKVTEAGLKVCLATATAAHPAWMAHRHPDILRVDHEGRKRTFGKRGNSCPHSPTYRTYAPRLAGLLAERYGANPAVAVWHISNEYGGYCYCDSCAAAFRVWLRARYGSLATLNERWYTRFWSHTFYDWDEIVPPNALSESTTFHALTLDYARFQSDSLLDCCRLEIDAIRRHSPAVPITTNFMGSYKPLNYQAWAKHLDVISWDSYPSNRSHWTEAAFGHDLMRGLKNGQPFMLMEQTPSQVNWAPYCALKKPGMMRLQSYQAVAHGADTVMFFQLRQSRGSSEKFHGAVISHAGHEHTRVFREVAELGQELVKLGDALPGARVPARAAIFFDWENWWAMENVSGPSKDWTYMPQVLKYYRALREQNIAVDVIGPDTDLSGYAVVVAPSLYMLRAGYGDRVEAFVANGGTFVTTFMSGLVDENDLVTTNGYPGDLRRVLGIWVEEFDGLFPDQRNAMVVSKDLPELVGAHEVGLICSILHAETADVVGTYRDDFYAGTPALTRNRFGSGSAWYIAADPDPSFVAGLMQHVCASAGISPALGAPAGVEVALRTRDGASFLFVLNHNPGPVTVDLAAYSGIDLLTGADRAGQMDLPGFGVAILSLV